jgi:hypothetical protein
VRRKSSGSDIRPKVELTLSSKELAEVISEEEARLEIPILHPNSLKKVSPFCLNLIFYSMVHLL